MWRKSVVRALETDKWIRNGVEAGLFEAVAALKSACGQAWVWRLAGVSGVIGRVGASSKFGMIEVAGSNHVTLTTYLRRGDLSA